MLLRSVVFTFYTLFVSWLTVSCDTVQGFCPDFTDTLLKAHNGTGGVSWEHDGGFQPSTNVKRWRMVLG
jgi:hypothetical protein